jgi:hypothetical protein
LDVQLFVNLAHMNLHCVEGDAELVTDLLVKTSVDQQRQNFLLARRKFFRVGRRLADFVKMVHNLARDLHGHRRTPRAHLLDGGNQFHRERFFSR